MPNLTPDELLTTTRAVHKRLDFDRPVPREVLGEREDDPSGRSGGGDGHAEFLRGRGRAVMQGHVRIPSS